jgi:hypothetical protein
MFRRGARKLAFLSRSGASSDTAKSTVDWLLARNIEVSVYKGDVADFKTVQECIGQITNLGGVFQAAMVLRDTPLIDMTIGQWQACVRPKVQGTDNLDRATSHLKLDFFICFSSISGVVGAKGQSNYSAANNYLDALMRNRRERGLAGTTMNVGLVSGIGVAAEDAALMKVMDRMGYESINEEELFYQIEEAVATKDSTVTQINGFDQHQIITGINMTRKDVYWVDRPLCKNLYANLDLGESLGGSAGGFNLIAALQNAPDLESRTSVLMDAFIEKIANVLAVPASVIQPGNPLSAYGLDSIVAVEFRKWFSKSVSVEVALFDILGAKSIEALVSKVSASINTTSSKADTAEASSAAQSTEKSSGDVTTKAKTISLAQELAVMPKPANLPISTFQSRFWFLHNLLDDKSSLNYAVINYGKGQPRIDLLQRALEEVAQRNAIYRTAYFEGDDFAQQEVVDKFPAQIQSVDLSEQTDPKSALGDYIKDLRSAPLDIEQGEIVRASLIKLESESYALVFVFHHIAHDNGSAHSSMNQFTQIYDSLLTGKDLSLVAAPKISYADFSIWHNQKLESPEIQSAVTWWREQLSGAPTSSQLLPFAKSQRSTLNNSRQILRQTLRLSLMNRMKRVCARIGITPFHFLLGAFRSFIHRYTQEDDLTILMVDGNRPHPELEDVIGMFVNLVPVRLRNSCDSSFEELVQDVKDTVIEALKHSEVPFDTIVNATQGAKNSSHFPIGQIGVNYQMHGKPPVYKTANFEINDSVVEDIPTAYEMALEIMEDPQNGLNLRFEFDSDLYSGEDMERFFENFGIYVTSLIRDHRQPISEVEMCGPKELEYLRSNCWAGHFQPTEWTNQSVLSKITDAAKSNPQSIAVTTSKGDSVSYADLLLRAESIALMLQDSGARGLVGILASPTIETITAMVGVIQSNCGYVPLDPNFAKGRLSQMINDSSISVLLTGEGFEQLGKEVTVGCLPCPAVLPISLSKNIEPRMAPLWETPSSDDPFYIIYTSVGIPWAI